MHLTYELCTLGNTDSEWFHIVIVNISDVVLEDTLMIFAHSRPQLEPNIFIKVDVSIVPQVHTPQAFVIVSLCPSPEVFHGQIICQYQ